MLCDFEVFHRARPRVCHSYSGAGCPCHDVSDLRNAVGRLRYLRPLTLLFVLGVPVYDRIGTVGSLVNIVAIDQ